MRLKHRHGIPNCGESAGFSLLEILVALSIIAMVLIAVYKMHSQTISMNYSARFYATAPLLAQMRLASVNADTVSESGEFGPDFPGYRWLTNVSEVNADILGNFARQLKRIDIRIDFNEDNFSYEFRSYRAFWE